MKVLRFLSTNYRELYLNDDYRVLAAPDSYIIKFRYQRKWIQPEVLKEVLLGHFQGTNAIIEMGVNDNEIEQKNVSMQIFPLRRASVAAIRYPHCNKGLDSDSDLFEFYLKLGDFIKYRDNYDTSVFKFVSFADDNHYQQTNWDQLTDDIRKRSKVRLFGKAPLINIVGLGAYRRKKGNSDLPTWEELSYKNTYKLKNDSLYFIRIKEKKYEDADLSQPVSLDLEDITQNNSEKNESISLNAPRDQVDIEFFTKSSSEKSENVDLKISTSDCIDLNTNNISLSFKVSLSKKLYDYIVIFVSAYLLSLSIVLGSRQVSLSSFLFPIIPTFVACLLFWAFNKK
ncbi:hypothetical protein ATX59_07415 [Oenococcus oeni]|uniref:Uncharacterized protein n=1 Tax=Oenococcus oeni TaxID=1247 RepID=A0A6N4A563_OENOE|nr:hypothetical protein [Oenococcus oeni]OIM20739.1 hypothetical protein ATX59_07415 [Oenococcus oeni]